MLFGQNLIFFSGNFSKLVISRCNFSRLFFPNFSPPELFKTITMENKQYLTFRLHDLQYGIEAPLVQELFPLPELTFIAEAPTEIIGILNVRGQIVPMMHFDLLQGHLLKYCQLSDYVILLQWEGLLIGLVVHQVNEVLELNTEVIETESLESLGDLDPALIAGVAKVDEDIIILLDPQSLIGQPDTLLTLIWDAQSQLDGMAASAMNEVEQEHGQDESQPDEELQSSKVIPNFYDLYCPTTTPEEREIFRARADNLKPQIESVKLASELMTLAVISFGDEYFGLDLELVQEFTDISNLTPVPCCPKHIVGNMNLRGEIVTLVDIRNVLNLPTPAIGLGAQAVVIQVDDIVAGLPVERVSEMVSVNHDDLTPLPTVLSDFGEQYIRGTAFFEEKMLKILDLPKIFAQGGLVVNEQA
jgi:purine-binding chemotaxis protein CheW